MARTKRTTPADGTGAPLRNDVVRIRMYRIGFGDCFLVSLPLAEGGHDHILIDCGVHSRGNIGLLDNIAADIAQETGKELALVIATHSHQDHISGFDPKRFQGFRVREVWLPWTENPGDHKAVRFARRQAELALQLRAHFNAHRPTAAAAKATRAAAQDAVTNLIGEGNGKLASNKTAMQLLRSGFGSNASVRYVEAGDEIAAPGKISDLSVTVLGPPRDPAFLRKMDPPQGAGYLRLGPDGKSEPSSPLPPFTSKWVVKRNDTRLKGLRIPSGIESELKQSLVYESLDGLAFSLDQVKNNTSVVALLCYRGQYLLFPGDAQYGSWKSWLEKDDSDEILSRISFLKVAHHGSHNATPKAALENMSGKFAAMVSTQNAPWPSIPRAPLMARLNQLAKNGVVRSDSLQLGHDDGPPMPKLPSHYRKGTFWYDYEISM